MYYLLLISLMILLPILYLKYLKKQNNKQIEKALIPKFQGLKKEAIGSFALFGALVLGFFVIIFAISLTEVIVTQATGQDFLLNDLTKVGDIIFEDVTRAPESFFILLVIVIFVEEFFFRAFLVPRIGIVPSTLLFTIAHYGYGSISEIIGAFFLGLILAYWFKRNNSLIQNYFGHLAYDLFAILLYFIGGV